MASSIARIASALARRHARALARATVTSNCVRFRFHLARAEEEASRYHMAPEEEEEEEEEAYSDDALAGRKLFQHDQYYVPRIPGTYCEGHGPWMCVKEGTRDGGTCPLFVPFRTSQPALCVASKDRKPGVDCHSDMSRSGEPDRDASRIRGAHAPVCGPSRAGFLSERARVGK